MGEKLAEGDSKSVQPGTANRYPSDWRGGEGERTKQRTFELKIDDPSSSLLSY